MKRYTYNLTINQDGATVRLSFASKDTVSKVYVALYSAYRNGINGDFSASIHLEDNGFETLIDSFGEPLNIAEAFAK